jgi:C4-dicarboxylate transporter DctQ subunit
METLPNYLSIVCFVLMSIFVLAGVAMRFIIQAPFPWGEEISRYLMVVAVALGIGQGVREKAHLGVTMIVSAVPPLVGRIMDVVASLICIFAYSLISYCAYSFTMRNYRFGQKSPALDLPMYVMYAILAIGFVMSAVESLNMLFRLFSTPMAEKQRGSADTMHLG